jgi:D-beta-D-heptose 7-phosphate kinase/D-beta-D-heptose 1-phosphate adenosyltransferase
MTMAIPDWSRAPVLVVGDLILDRFVQGAVRRISPEAPIPVVEVTGERRVVGGAANVAHNILALGGKVTLLGAVGEDRHGDSLRALLAQLGLDPEGALRVPGRITTVKTRIIAQHQQVVRVDRETREPLDEELWESLEIRIRERLSSHRALVVSDYAKGIFTASRLKTLGRLAQETGIPYVVDPKPAHFPYPGATVVTPNRQEAAAIYGRTFATKELVRVAADLFGRTDWDAILFTLGEEGMALAHRDGSVERIFARVREVFDVTGAGDTVVAALALALASGIPLLDAARLANAAAGVVVGKPGTAVCSAQELAEALRGSS